MMDDPDGMASMNPAMACRHGKRMGRLLAGLEPTLDVVRFG